MVPLTASATWTLGDADPSHPTGDGVSEPELLSRLSVALSPRYDIRDRLGSGGFGSVYRAIDARTGQSVAVKVLRPQASWSPAAVAAQVARFEREATLCAALQHPNVVRLLDRGHTGELYYAVYELVPGETLRSLLDREHHLSVERTADIMSQVLDAVATAHAAGVVHRDLKPANIMVVSTGVRAHVKVLDFGISTLTLEARDTAFHNVTRTHELIGTPQYCAPEQLRGDAPTPRTDVYAWGLVFIECLTGRRAISGSTLAEIYHQHLSPVEIPLPASLVGHPLGDFLRRVLRKNPGERAPDAAALHAELKRLPIGDLVGLIEPDHPTSAAFSYDPARPQSPTFAWVERRQVTAIALQLRIVPHGVDFLDPEALDPILRDQLALCRDGLARYGGAVVGEVGDLFLVMFGYPTASDADARHAVRTVLEISEDIRRRSGRLTTTHRLALQLRIGMHTGPVTVVHGQPPTGITPTRALALAAAAPPDSIIVSAESRRLFEPFAVLEASAPVSVSGEARPVKTALLTAERRHEALSFRPGHAVAIPFIGRRAELAQIEEHMALSTARGQVHGALVIGEAGIGKSRLVREVLTRARASGRPVIECRCLVEHKNVALWPILPVLREQLGLHTATDAGAGDLLVTALTRLHLDPSGLVPILCAWLDIPLPTGFEPVQVAPYRQRELLLAALVTLLTEGAENRAAVLLFEDLHWSDPTTLDLVARLLQAQSAAPQYLICTGRPQLSPPWKTSRTTRVNLDRLSPIDAEHLARDILGPGVSPPREVLSAIVDRADGIPLFVEELARMVVERGAGKIDVREIPITLRDSLSSRLDQLGEARAVVQIAAALGREFEGPLLLETAGGDEIAVEAALEKLIDGRLLYRRRWVSGSTYVFRHALIQEAAYESMPRDLRRRVHARVASVLDRESPGSSHGSPAELARHHAGAGDFESAVRRGTEAAQLCVDRTSNAEAIAEADQVAAWLPELPEGAREDAELRLNGIKLQALMSMQGWASDNVRALAEKSRALIGKATTVRHAVSILYCLFLNYHVASEHDASHRVADELIELSDRVSDPSLQCLAATAKGAAFRADGSFLRAEPWLTRALDLYDPSRDQYQGPLFGTDSRVWAGASLALVQWGMGRTQRAFQLADGAIAWAREIKHVPSLGLALLYASQVHQMNGDKASVRRTAGELLDASRTYGLPALEGYGATLASWAESDLAGVDRIIGTLKALNCNLKLTYYGSLLVDIEAEAGRFPEAIAQVETWLTTSKTFHDHAFLAELLRRRGVYEMRLPAPDADLARRSLTEARRLACEQGMYRVEAAAIRDHDRLFGPAPEHTARLTWIHDSFPDLSPSKAADPPPTAV
ncbi:MAG: TOMM system kinase/cyclase fusion protein [Polyangiaceae bacterium]